MLVFALFAALVGCADKLPKATEIVHMRILGSLLEVIGDETRTSPMPGEHLRVSMISVFPEFSESTDPAQSIFISCTAPTRFSGTLPLCQEFLDAAAQGSVDVSSVLALAPSRIHCKDIGDMRTFSGVSVGCVEGNPVTEVAVADDFKASQKLLLGVVCEAGGAYIDPADPLLFGCEGKTKLVNSKKVDAETMRVNALITVEQSAADENHNPSADAIDMKFEVTGNESWIALDPKFMPSLETNCEDQAGGPSLPKVDYLEHTLTLSYLASEREKVSGKPEDLEFTVYATSGTLERRFTIFPGTDSGKGNPRLLTNSLHWTPPDSKTLAGISKLVRFFVTVRDHRGGFAIMSRAACVLGPPETSGTKKAAGSKTVAKDAGSKAAGETPARDAAPGDSDGG
jgi:hypothetical protein